jgi:hypothetical protein
MKVNNKISKGLISALLVLLTISCNEDILDKNPLDSLSSQDFWTSKADVETALAGVYSRLQSSFLGYERIYYDGLSDDAWADPTNVNQSNIANMTTGGISPALTGAISNMYNAPYVAIASCNFFLDNVNKAPLTEAELDVYKAEVRFIRALCYFDLVRLFGDVIIYRNYFKTLDDAKVAKSAKADVYAFIEEDLNFAISKLPDTKYTAHAVKGSAQGLLGRVLLTQKKWDVAATMLKQVMDGGNFQLSDNYRELFTPAGQAKANVNREIIFSTRYLAPNNVHRLSPSFAGMNIEFGWWLMLQPYKDLADAYQMTDGLAPGVSPLDPTGYANRDPRLDLTMRLPGEVWQTPTGTPWNDVTYVNPTGFRIEKYVDLSKIPFTNNTANSTDQDMIHLRYADILLMYAEAKNEDTGPDASVYDAINQVRARQGINMPAVDQGVYDTKEELRDFIRNERRVELALEGHRYFDIKRWEIAHIKLPTMKNAVGTQMVFEMRNYYLPFRQSELDNNTKLRQTDDY